MNDANLDTNLDVVLCVPVKRVKSDKPYAVQMHEKFIKDGKYKMKKKNYYSNGYANQLDLDKVDITNSDVFNIIENKDDNIAEEDTIKNRTWKELNEEEKIEKCESYFNIHDYIGTHIKESIIKLIKDNKMNIKKNVIFDEINQRIDNFPIIKFDNHDKIFYIDKSIYGTITTNSRVQKKFKKLTKKK
jgi:hypothetical protein